MYRIGGHSLPHQPSGIRRARTRTALVVVAHPDDEAIFFFETISRLIRKGFSVYIFCATGKFGGYGITRTRLGEFYESCRACGAEGQCLGLEDTRGRPLCMDELQVQLRTVSPDIFDCAFTHGPWGDYGHIHHSCVCLAVHAVFGDRVLSLAGPLMPEIAYRLSEASYTIKLRHMKSCYPSQRFAWTWPTRRECYVRFRPAEARLLAMLALGIDAPPFSLYSGDLTCIRARILSEFLRGYSQPLIRIPPELEWIPEKVWGGSISRCWASLRGLAESAGVVVDD